jgi:intein-encoded DNA endonuclease-like protein
MRYNYTKSLIKKMKHLYVDKLLSTQSIGKILNMSESSVRKKLHDIGVVLRSKFQFSKKYYIDETFFETINTEEKAYFLGWMYSDGCVYSNKKGHMFHLTLNKKDISVLESFKKILKTNTPIHKMKNRDTYGFFVWSKKMYFDLINLGCVPRKSLILKFPTLEQVPENLMRHFIRGYFDGDGSVTFNKKNYRMEAKIISSSQFCRDYELFLTKKLKITQFYHGKIYYSKVAKLPYYSIGMGSFNNIKILYDYLYKNCKFFLKRKKDVFDRYFLYKSNIQTYDK